MSITARPSIARFILRSLEHAFAIYAGITGARAEFARAFDGRWSEGSGSLTVHRGRRFLHLEGSPRQMGLQHGRLLRPLIRALLRHYITALHRFRGLSRKKLLRHARLAEPFIPAHLIEEMRGIAEGAEIPYDDVLIGNTFLETAQSIACSCYAAWDTATSDRRLVFARNLEFFTMGVAHHAQIVLFQKPDRGIPFVAVTWPGLCGTLTAVNLEGLAMGPLNVNPLINRRRGQPYPLTFRLLIQRCATCDEALQLIKTTPRTYPNNLLIAQTRPAPRAIVVEYTPDTFAVRRPRPGNHFILATNHFRKLGRKQELPETRGYIRYPALFNLLRRHAGRLTIRSDLFSHPAVHLPNSMHCFLVAPEQHAFRLALGSIPAARAPYRTFTYDRTGIHLPAPH